MTSRFERAPMKFGRTMTGIQCFVGEAPDNGREGWRRHLPGKDWLEQEYLKAVESFGSTDFRYPDDVGWYLDRMRTYLRMLEHAADVGDVEHSIIYASEIGALRTEYNLKMDCDTDVERGRNQVQKAAEGGEKRGLAVAQRNEAIRAAYFKRLRNQSAATAKRQTGKEFDLSPKQVGRIVK